MKFFKYYANGNDFVIFNAELENGQERDFSALAREICDRFKGIGADGLIAILPHEKCDFKWDFYNKDGSKAAMCGNGSRAAAHFAHHFNGAEKKLSFLSLAGEIEASIENDDVEVLFTKPKILELEITRNNKIWHLIDTGVPHLVHFCEDLSEFNEELCANLRAEFNANVNFAKINSNKSLSVRTFERGVEGETLACGTGMGACFYLANYKNLIQNQAKITPKSDEFVEFRLDGEKIYFKGKVRFCFEANYNFS